MSLHDNYIVDVLVKNIGISNIELYEKSTIKNMRQFLGEINVLLFEHRIIKEHSPWSRGYKYSPKILLICVHEKSSNIKIKEHLIDFIPTKELENEFEYINTGTEQEDCLEFELQITGFYLKEKYKNFLEEHTGLFLDFEKYDFYMWAKFLDPFPD